MNVQNPGIAVVLGAMLLITGVLALALGPRGGRLRALPGWIGFWLFFTIVLLLLSRVSVWLSLPLLGLVQFATLREYFFLAPLRPQDRWAILFAYLSIPAGLYPVVLDSYGLFLTLILIYLFLLLPTMLSLGSSEKGLLDSLGRVLLGLLVYVFCGAHLGFMVSRPTGTLELFGVLVAGLLVCLSVTAGGLVTEAVAHDLSVSASESRVGRAALLDRITPAIYAAPLYFHFLRYFH
jgi:predicted CDP-diglyceride synthetase/phosphatidate cytidylyltransferase